MSRKIFRGIECVHLISPFRNKISAIFQDIQTIRSKDHYHFKLNRKINQRKKFFKSSFFYCLIQPSAATLGRLPNNHLFKFNKSLHGVTRSTVTVISKSLVLNSSTKFPMFSLPFAMYNSILGSLWKTHISSSQLHAARCPH